MTFEGPRSLGETKETIADTAEAQEMAKIAQDLADTAREKLVDRDNLTDASDRIASKVVREHPDQEEQAA